jgi:predicted dehydrogenase
MVRPGVVRGAGKGLLRVGLVGCGGRGTNAAQQLLAGNENVELVAMGDVFEDQLQKSLDTLKAADQKAWGVKDPSVIAGKVKVDAEHQFSGFDAFRKVIASDVDVVMLCTPPGYRPMHFEAAIDAKKHVFAEKPIATDPVGVRRFMAAAKKAEQLRLTVMSGAQYRSQREYRETRDRIHQGAIGEMLAIFSWYYSGPVMKQTARNPKWGDMEWQHRNWYSYVWICGDQIVEQHFHNIDTMSWIMGAHPERVVATGGAAWRPRDEVHGNIYDHMTSQFVYPNGVRLSSSCRQYPNVKGIYRDVGNLIVGSKGKSDGKDLASPGEPFSPYVQEHIDMVKSIRGEGPYINQGMSVAESTMTCIMARESAYSGQEITWDQIMASKLDLQPKEFGYKLPMEAPPLPVPGVYKFI